MRLEVESDRRLYHYTDLNKLLCHAKLNKWDYSNSFQQYAYEEEWYSAERMYTGDKECLRVCAYLSNRR